MNELTMKNQQKVVTNISIDLKTTGDKHLAFLMKKKHGDQVIPSDPEQKIKQLRFGPKPRHELVLNSITAQTTQIGSEIHKRSSNFYVSYSATFRLAGRETLE